MNSTIPGFPCLYHNPLLPLAFLFDSQLTTPQMETINKLLKKQAPKTNRRVGHLPGDESPPEFPKPNPVFIRWVSSKKGSIVAVPEEIIEGPVGRVFVPGGSGLGKTVEEVS